MNRGGLGISKAAFVVRLIVCPYAEQISLGVNDASEKPIFFDGRPVSMLNGELLRHTS